MYKKKLYESIMRSVSKTVKHKLNENNNIKLPLISIKPLLTSLYKNIDNKELSICRKKMPFLLEYLISKRIAVMTSDGEECYLHDDFNYLKDFDDETVNIDNIYIAFNYDEDNAEQHDAEYHYRFAKKQLFILKEKLQPIFNKLNCECKADEYMMFINYRGPLTNIEELKNAIISLSKIQIEIDKHFANFFM